VTRTIGCTTVLAMLALAAAAGASTPAAGGHPLASTLALPVAAPDAAALTAGAATFADGATGELAFLRRKRAADAPQKPVRPPVTLSAERARVLLRSLTVPGWGQLTTGHPTAATVFGVAEAGVWTTYVAFRIQNQMRRDSYIRNAHVIAGIDLHDRDEEFQRIVGSFVSSDEYNQLVVARDAANLYYDNPQQMQDYIDAHSLRGADTWTWPDVDALLRYRGQRKNAQKAALRANAALAMAVVNRLVSAVHAARLRDTTPAAHSWEFQAEPAGDDTTAFRVGFKRRF